MIKTATIEGFPNYTISTGGKVYNTVSGKDIKSTVDGRGYHYVTIRDMNNVWIKKRVHVLVGDTFHRKRGEREIFDHRNGDKNNNRKDNLRVLTYSGNTLSWHKLKNEDWYGDSDKHKAHLDDLKLNAAN